VRQLVGVPWRALAAFEPIVDETHFIVTQREVVRVRSRWKLWFIQGSSRSFVEDARGRLPELDILLTDASGADLADLTTCNAKVIEPHSLISPLGFSLPESNVAFQ
jgi:hypothetical protein